MKSLFVLHDQPRMGAQMLADVHLRPTLTVACKLMASAVCRAAPKEVTEDKNIDNMREFKYSGILLMPPYPGPNPWVDWAMSNYHYFWWLIETAWWTDKELQHRFRIEQTPLYLRASKLVEAGIARHFPKPDMAGVNKWPTPGLLMGDEVDSHRQFYRTLKGKVRMKWTGRETPNFMREADGPVVCPECKAPKPLTGICDTGCFYGRN